MTTVQQSNFTADISGQDNFGKTFLANASAKAKEVQLNTQADIVAPHLLLLKRSKIVFHREVTS